MSAQKSGWMMYINFKDSGSKLLSNKSFKKLNIVELFVLMRKVINCSSAKHMWDTIELLMKGSLKLKKTGWIFSLPNMRTSNHYLEKISLKSSRGTTSC